MIDKDLQVHNDHQDMMVVVETAKEVTIPSEQNRHNCWAIKSRERCEVSHHQKKAQDFYHREEVYHKVDHKVASLTEISCLQP